MTTVLFFRRALTQEGGAERLLFEVARRTKRAGYEVSIVVLSGGDTKKLFGGRFSDIPVRTLRGAEHPARLAGRITLALGTLRALRHAIREINPEYIHGQESYDAELLYLATWGTRYRYSTFVHQTFFWAAEETLKYFFPFRRHLAELRRAVRGHQEFIPATLPPTPLGTRLVLSVRAVLNYLAVRRATAVVTPSAVMGREVLALYGRPAVPLKMGIDPAMFEYAPTKDMKRKLGIAGTRMLLDVSRLAPQKRLDLAIRAFAELHRKFPDTRFVIGGRGPEKERLEALVRELRLEGKVLLLGFVPEDDLYDLYAACDLAFHPTWIDFDISVMEPLALGKKVVVSTEYDLIDNLLKLNGELIFPADPTVPALSVALERALAHRPQLPAPARELLGDYTWDRYTEKLLAVITAGRGAGAARGAKRYKVAYLISHPIQYYGFLFRKLAAHPDVDLTVYYCFSWGTETFFDPEFGTSYKWDIPLLEGYRHVFLKNYSRHPSPRFFGQVNPGILRELRRERYDALIVHGYTSCTSWMAFAGAKLTGTPLILRGITHLLDEKPRTVRFAKQLVLRTLFRLCSACLYIGTNNRAYYHRYGVPDSKLFFTPHVVDNEFWSRYDALLRPRRKEVRAVFGFADDRPLILFVGKLIPKKRPLWVLEAFTRVRAKYPCGLLFAGEGPLRKDVEERVARERIPDVAISGFLNQTDLPRAYVAGDVFAIPSAFGETWGLVVNEAMNFSLPVIISDKVGCGPELVHPDENGFIVSNETELARAFEFLVSDDAARRRFGARSKELISAWNGDACIAGMLRAFSAVGRRHHTT